MMSVEQFQDIKDAQAYFEDGISHTYRVEGKWVSSSQGNNKGRGTYQVALGARTVTAIQQSLPQHQLKASELDESRELS